MAGLNLIKLSVGSESVESLQDWQGQRLSRHGRLWHATRMMPRRREELLDPGAASEGGGSIYWVIRGLIQARQRLVGIEEAPDEEGRAMTLLLLDPTLVRVEPRRSRPFQGWRYLAAEQAPPDLDSGRPAPGLREEASQEALPPPALLAELRDLGIL